MPATCGRLIGQHLLIVGSNSIYKITGLQGQTNTIINYNIQVDQSTKYNEYTETRNSLLQMKQTHRIEIIRNFEPEYQESLLGCIQD